MSGVAAPCSEPAARRKLTIFRTAASSGWIEAESDECRWVQVDVSQACLVPRTAKRGRDVLDWLASVMGQGAGKRELKPELDRSAGRVCRGIQIVDFVCYWPADDEKLRRGPDESAHRVVDRRHPFRLREGTFDDRSCPVGIRSNHVRLWIVSAAHGVRHDEVEVLMEKARTGVRNSRWQIRSASITVLAPVAEVMVCGLVRMRCFQASAISVLRCRLSMPGWWASRSAQNMPSRRASCSRLP